MATTSRLITADELLHRRDDGFRYELVRGELKRMAPAGRKHGKIAHRFDLRLGQFVEAHNLGVVYAAETGFVLASNPDTVRAPDVAFVSREREALLEDTEGFFRGAPDLAVEVLSPGDTYTEVEEKTMEWLEGGARLVVVVDPRKRTVTVYRGRDEIRILTETDTLDGGDVVPGWTLGIRELFR